MLNEGANLDVPKNAATISMAEMRKFVCAEIARRVRSGEVSLESIEAMVINGQLPSEDIDLLVEEDLVSKEDAARLLEDSQEEIDEALAQARAFSLLVIDGKVSHEELQVMRVKGVLGNSVIHFLVKKVGQLLMHFVCVQCWYMLTVECILKDPPSGVSF